MNNKRNNNRYEKSEYTNIETDSIYNIKKINSVFDNSREQFEKLQKESLDISDLHERLKFWSSKLVDFHKYMELPVLEASGMISTKFKHLTGGYFLDRLIKQEMEHLERCIKLDYEKEENEFSSTFESREAFFKKPMELVAYLDSLGINQYLMKSQGIVSKEGIGKFYQRVFNIKPNTFSQFLQRIRAEETKYNELNELIDDTLTKDKFKRIKND